MVENDAAAGVKPVVPCDDADVDDDDDSDFSTSKIVDTAPRAASMFVPYAKPPVKAKAAQHPLAPPEASGVPQAIIL